MKNKNKISIFPDLSPALPSVEIEEGVSTIVNIFNSKGLFTYMSCEGHAGRKDRDRAWIELDPCIFKTYMENNSSKMEQFLLAGEKKWILSIDYFGMSKFRGIGQPFARKSKLKRVVDLDMRVRVILNACARNKDKSKTKEMASMERAAKKYL